MSPKKATASAFAKASADKLADEPVACDDAVEARLYECMILYPADLSQKEEQDVVKEVENIWSEAGALMKAKDAWGKRGLAYPMRGNVEGKFIVYHFDVDPRKIAETNGALKIVKNLLRFLIWKPPKHYVIKKWSELYEVWLKERETLEQRRTREKEEKLQEVVAARALRQAQGKIRREEKKPARTKPALGEEKITEEIEKMIANDTLENL